MNHDSNRGKSVARNVLSCFAIAFVTVTLAMFFLCGGLYLAYRTVFSFENYRAQMCIREDLVVEDPHFVYSPGYDYIMWSKFDVRVDNIDKVFDARELTCRNFVKGTKCGRLRTHGGMRETTNCQALLLKCRMMKPWTLATLTMETERLPSTSTLLKYDGYQAWSYSGARTWCCVCAGRILHPNRRFKRSTHLRRSTMSTAHLMMVTPISLPEARKQHDRFV